MDPNRVITSLNTIPKYYSKILDDTASTVIASAVETIGITKTAYDEAKRQNRPNRPALPWGYTIYDTMPLRFKPAQVPNSTSDLQVDIYCDIRWEDDDLPVKQDIKVRIWCLHEDTIFREDFDAERILEELESDDKLHFPRPHKKSRVISRIHFDKANSGQAGPLYHLQYGGKSQPYELFWHPEKANVPRIEHQPMDLFLVCQMVAANFFPIQYPDIRKKPEWRAQVTWCQDKFLRQHYEQCIEALDNKQTTLLDVLWGVTM